MARLSVFEVIFIVGSHSITLIGKMWLIVMIFLRILMLIFAGYPLYQDEQERFVCNTIQPGCTNVCYDLSSHISLFRFWVVQLITLCLPYIIFVIYVVHKVSNSLNVRAMPLFKNHQDLFSQAEQGGWMWCFMGAYVLQLVFRTLLEATFGAAHYYLFGFSIPRRFLCQQSPCTTQVDCYISRPTEKTAMLIFMLAVAALSFVLNFLDFICIVKHSLKQKIRRKLRMENIYEEEQCFLSAGGFCKGSDPSAFLAQQDLQPEAGLSVSFRTRQGSQSSCSGQKTPCFEISSLPQSPGPSACNSNGNNGYSVAQDEAQMISQKAAPPEPLGTPRSFSVNKRSHLKPTPPPRRDTGQVPLGLPGPIGGICTVTATRRASHSSLVDLGGGTELQTSNDEPEKRSQWV